MLTLAAASRRPALLRTCYNSSIKYFTQTSKPGTPKPGSSKPGTAKPGTSKPGTAKLGTVKALPPSPEGLPTLPPWELPSFDTRAASLLDTLISAPKKTSSADLKRDKNIQNILEDSVSGLAKHERHQKDKRRISVISSSLCDDVLERLEPSLEGYEGCDIIDINPGVGIFSSKLHEHLKPRTHILMEPNQNVYSQFLQPLVDKPGSTFSMVSKSGIVWTELETILSKEHLPHQQAYAAGDPRLYEVNKTLLVVANLVFHPEKPYKGFTSLTRMVLYQFLSAIKANSLFHRYGLVRMLLWVGDDERTKVLPRAIGNRKKAEMEMELACSKVTEVASSTKAPIIHRLGRDPRLDFEDLPRVLKNMQKKGITIPAGRESVLLTELANESSEAMKGFRTLNIGVTSTFSQTKEMREAIVAQWDKAPVKEIQESIRQYMIKRSTILHQQSLMRALYELLELKKRMVALEKKIHVNTEDGVDKMKQELARLHDQYESLKIANTTTKSYEPLYIMLDNMRALHEHLMFWDQREYEPLRARTDEFFPPKEMALLDIVPASWPAMRDNYPESDEVMEFILAHLFLEPSKSLKAGLKSLWPGALDWLHENCPSLTDPSKGGCGDLDQLPVRRLSPEMALEILEAWFEWPWRPTRFDIMRQLGSINYDPDATDMDE